MCEGKHFISFCLLFVSEIGSQAGGFQARTRRGKISLPELGDSHGFSNRPGLGNE